MDKKSAGLERAQRLYRNLKAMGSEESKILLAVTLLERQMSSGKFSYADLDPKGERSDKEIRAEVKGYADAVYISRARRALQVMEKGSKNGITLKPEMMRDMLEDNLKRAGADYAALDTTGKRGAMEMRYAVNNAERTAHLRYARSKFQELKDGLSAETALAVAFAGGEYTTETVAQEVRDHIMKSGHRITALDPEGRKSDRELREELDTLAKEGKMEIKDRKTFRDVVTTFPRGGSGRGR